MVSPPVLPHLRKPFPYFLCHHKEGGGAFCRLLKIRLKRRCPGHGDVFLDADNLVDLSTLFDIVRERTDMLVVLCTRDILRRPWCVGEMTTARLRKVDTVLLIFPEFEWPSNTFIEDYVTHVEGVVSLAEYGIHVEMAQDTLRWLLVRPQIVLPHAMTMAGVDATVAKLIQRKHGRTETVSVVGVLSVEEGCDKVCVTHTESRLAPPPTLEVVSVVDHRTQESVCAALLLQDLLQRHYPLMGTGYVVGPDECLPESATTVLVVCSNGCFQTPGFVRQLLQAESRGVAAIPIIVDGSFRFPSEPMYQGLRADAAYIMQDSGRHVDDLIALIKDLFQQIAISLPCQDAQEILDVRAAAVANRLAAPRKLLQHMAPDDDVQDSDEIHVEVCDGDEFDEFVRVRL